MMRAFLCLGRSAVRSKSVVGAVRHHGGHGHGHPEDETPGVFDERAPPLQHPTRDFAQRSFTVGIGGPVGSGKTA